MCGRYTVYLNPRLIEDIILKSSEFFPLEVGSSLTGFYTPDGFDAHVEDTAPVPPDSKSSRTSFFRGVEGLKGFFKNLSDESHYVGEWHSHPNGPPFPSTVDDENESAISRDERVGCPESILIVIGGNPRLMPEVAVFVYSREKGRVDLSPCQER